MTGYVTRTNKDNVNEFLRWVIHTSEKDKICRKGSGLSGSRFTNYHDVAVSKGRGVTPGRSNWHITKVVPFKT